MTGKKLPLDFQAAIAKFEAARETLGAFRSEPKHARVLETHDHLRDSYNSALNEVKTKYKEHAESIGRKYGEFSAVVKVDIDADRLLELLGPTVDPILKIKYTVDRDLYNKAVAEGIIPQEVVAEVEKEKDPEIRGPKAA